MEHAVVNSDWDYVYFTDNKDLIAKGQVGAWTIKPLAYTKSTLVKQNRWHKTHPHILFPEYDYSLYIDSNISIIKERVFDKVDEFIKRGILIAVPSHPERRCIYQEAEVVKDTKIDQAKTVNRQMKILRKAHYPENNGLFENCIIFRQHNKLAKVMDQWWNMIHRYSKRDQLSFNYIMWKNKVPVTPFYDPYENHHTNGDFEFVIGAKHTQDKIGGKGKFWHIYLFGCKIYTHKQKNYDEIYAKRFGNIKPAEIRYCLKEQFKRHLGYPLDLRHPKTFNEKLQWLKLHEHNPLITKCADKVAVRDYIKEKIGEEYLVPCLGVWDNPNDIDFDKLPNQFVLKVNWGSGQNIIVKDKTSLDITDVRNKLAAWMAPESNHYFAFFEWGYKDIKPKIICEKYIEESENKPVSDYKFFCYHGQPKYMYVAVDSFNYKRMRINYYDCDFNKLPLTRHYPNTDYDIPKPKKWDRMIELSKILSEPFLFVRVDFFIVGNSLKVGELTFYPGAGLDAFEPTEWDYKFGNPLKLPLR